MRTGSVCVASATASYTITAAYTVLASHAVPDVHYCRLASCYYRTYLALGLHSCCASLHLLLPLRLLTIGAASSSSSLLTSRPLSLPHAIVTSDYGLTLLFDVTVAGWHSSRLVGPARGCRGRGGNHTQKGVGRWNGGWVCRLMGAGIKA